MTHRDKIVEEAACSIRRGSKSFSLASTLFSKDVRERVWLLYAWCRACDDITDNQDHGFTSAGVTWPGSASELTAIALETSDPVPAAFEGLRILSAETSISRQHIRDHLIGFELDQMGWEPQDETDLLGYCYHVAGVVGSMMAATMGVPYEDADTLERAKHLGIAFQLNNISRDIYDDSAIGRCYIPRSWLSELSIERSDLTSLGNKRSLAQLASRMVQRADLYNASARVGASRLPWRSRLAVLTASNIYGEIGAIVRDREEAAWDERVSTSSARKVSLLMLSIMQSVRPAPPADHPIYFDEALWRVRLKSFLGSTAAISQ